MNLDNKISLWNGGAEKILGWTGSEVIGHVPEELLGAEFESAMSKLRTGVEGKGFWNGDLPLKARDGRKLILDCHVTMVRDERGRPRARLSVFSDVTGEKLLEEKFLLAQRLESLGMLAAGIAHDLNNVLAPIVFATPMLRGSLSAAGDLKILDALEQSASRGSNLVKQILAFAHGTTGEFQATQMKHILRDIVDILVQTLPKTIRVEHQIPSGLWLTHGNATQLHQVILNLCVNARDAMPKGGTLRIRAANRNLDEEQARGLPGARPGAWVFIEVSDTGTGIPADVVPHIWEPFFTTKDPGKGTGLGLSTVRDIIERHGGFVSLDTQPNKGTAFRVFLPATLDKPAASAGTQAPATPDGHNELILVVDDDQAIREMITTSLTRHTSRVVSAGDGMEAIGIFTARAAEIALVLTDLDMPNLDGASLARILTWQHPNLRLLVMSGLAESKSAGSEIGAVQKLALALLLKPFTEKVLLKSIHELLTKVPKLQ